MNVIAGRNGENWRTDMSTRSKGPRGFSEETVRGKTGKSSEEWYALLGAWDAPEKGHTATAKYLRDEHDVDSWWAQSVTVRYEYTRGLRQPPSETDG